MMMNRPKRSPRKKQSPSFIYTATVKRSRKEDVETNKCISASGRTLSEKTATVNGAKNGAKKRLAKSTTSAIGAKKVIKKLFLNGKLQKRKRSPKQKTNSVESNEENATDEDCDTSRQLEMLIEEKLDTELSHGDVPQMMKVKFHTDRLQTWVDTFEEFYSEQHVKGMTCVPVTNKIEGGTEICIKKDCSNAASRDWIVVRFCGSDVMLQGSGLEQWKRTDFPALMDRVKNSVEKCVKEATGCGAQKLSVPSPAKKRSRLSLKSARVGRQDGGAVSKLAPLFKRCASQKDGKQSQDAKSGNAKGLKNCEPGDTKDTPCVAALHNLGNTCFLSSVLQVLRYTPGFVDNISKLAKEVKLCGVEDTNNDDDEENLTWTLISNLDQVYKDMHEAEGRVSRCENSYLAVRPYQLMDTIEKLNPMFEGNLQQDAHELLRCLLSYVQDATKAVNKHRKTAKMASATASMALPVTPLDQKYNVKTENEMTKVVAAAVCMVMCSSKSSDTDGDKTSESFDNDTDHAMKRVGVKREIGDGVVNEFKGQASCKLNSQPSCNSRPLEGWVTKSLTKHVIVENTHLTNGWDTTEKNFNHDSAYGSTATFSETTEIGNRILSTSVGMPEKICRKKMSSSPIKCGTSISPLKAKRSLDLVTSSEASKKRINGKHVYENSALDMNGSANLEAQADLLSEKLKQLTQSKSDTNICDLGHQQSTRWRSRSAGDVRGCGHVTKKRRTRGATAGWRNHPDIMDMFSRQLTGGATNGVNGDNNVNMKERLLGKIRNVDEEISMSVTNVAQNGIVDNEAEICSTRNTVTHNTSCKNNIVKKQTARKSACGYFLSLSRHVNGNDDRNKYENRETTIPEEDVDQSMFSGTTVTESNSPRKKTCEELKSIALANGKSAVVRLRKSAVSDYFKTMAEKQQVADYIEDLFQGSMALRTRCLECEGFTERKEAYQDIGVPVRNERRDDDEEDSDSEETDTPHGWILAALDDVERLQDDNKYVCERCCHLVEAERSMHYVTLPRILTLHLKRFAATSRCLGGVTKINDHVRIPMILPCIQDGCRESCTTDNHRYELYAVVTHTGISISSGHYVAYVRMLPPTGKHDRDVDGSTNLHPKSETANFAVSVSNRIADYPGGDAVMADPNNNADTNNNVDVAPGTLLDTGVNNIVSPSGEQTEQPGDEMMYWYGCDDDAITVLTQDELECILAPSGGGSPYLLFYHKVGLLQESSVATTA